MVSSAASCTYAASPAEAVAYWWLEGMPDRMDEDLIGVPCETVYPASAVFDF